MSELRSLLESDCRGLRLAAWRHFLAFVHEDIFYDIHNGSIAGEHAWTKDGTCNTCGVKRMSELQWLELWLEEIERKAFAAPTRREGDTIRLIAWERLMRFVDGDCLHDFTIGNGEQCAICGADK